MSASVPPPNEALRQVREFYETIGWSRSGADQFQNARYEDLRPVSRGYVQRSHARVGERLPERGNLMLDAGSGPIQYAEYVDYSKGFRHRVCVDLSRRALHEARKRIGDHGLYVQADMSHLPLRSATLDAAVSLHALHHLPEALQSRAVAELKRVLAEGARAVVVNGWPRSLLMDLAAPGIALAEAWQNRRNGRGPSEAAGGKPSGAGGTWIHRVDAGWWRARAGDGWRVEIRVWRSVSVRFLRALVHPRAGGAWFLTALAWLEDLFPKFFGWVGQYPLIVLSNVPADPGPAGGLTRAAGR